MKKALIIGLLFFNVLVSMAGQDLFSYDAKALENDFEDLERLENIVLYNEGLSLPELLEKSGISGLASGWQFQTPRPGGRGDIPPFVIGCCLGPVGVAILLASSDTDAELVFKSVFGCMIPSAIFSLGIYYEDPLLIHLAIDLAIEILEMDL